MGESWACIDKFFASKEENFYFKGIHMLPEKWQKVINSDGDYFENEMFVQIFVISNKY